MLLVALMVVVGPVVSLQLLLLTTTTNQIHRISSHRSSCPCWRRSISWNPTTTTTVLGAKKQQGGGGKTKKRKPAAAILRGGFGRPNRRDKQQESRTAAEPTAAARTPVDNDFAIFPALEPGVRDTLVPAPDDDDGGMSTEIYQRLDQIYGFPNFNYQTAPRTTTGAASPRKDDEDDDSSTTTSSILSLEDMISNPASARDDADVQSSTAPTTSSLENSSSTDLDSLLAAATGGAASTLIAKKKKAEPISSSFDNNDNHCSVLNRLPPFEHIRVLHVDPLVLTVDHFFTDAECDRYVQASLQHSQSRGRVRQSRSPTVGKDAAAQAQRTSTTFYHMYRDVPELMSKASRLMGLATTTTKNNSGGVLNPCWEEPQTVRYRRNEKFTWHLDALGPMEQQQSPAGQRTATLLVYLTDLEKDEGGATLFRDLGSSGAGAGAAGADAAAGADVDADAANNESSKYLRVQPRKGSALLFFPAAGGIPNCPFDIRTLHAGQVVAEDSANDKWIAQLWLRQRAYRPTVPPGNRHEDADPAIVEYCERFASSAQL